MDLRCTFNSPNISHLTIPRPAASLTAPHPAISLPGISSTSVPTIWLHQGTQHHHVWEAGSTSSWSSQHTQHHEHQQPVESPGRSFIAIEKVLKETSCCITVFSSLRTCLQTYLTLTNLPVPRSQILPQTHCKCLEPHPSSLHVGAGGQVRQTALSVDSRWLALRFWVRASAKLFSRSHPRLAQRDPLGVWAAVGEDCVKNMLA